MATYVLTKPLAAELLVGVGNGLDRSGPDHFEMVRTGTGPDWDRTAIHQDRTGTRPVYVKTGPVTSESGVERF